VSATVVILHQSLPQDAAPDDKDVLIQASSVADALEHLGYRAVIEPFELDIAGFSSRLSLLDPVCVFNLVESLDNDGRLIHLACSILDHLGVPYTGANAEAMFLTSNKVLAKRWMLLAGIPTPEWVVRGTAPECGLPFPAKYIVKPLWEEASIGLDQGSVQEAADMAGLMDLLENRSLMLGRKCFAERFIDGREFNLSMLARSDGAEVLPPAEIVFTLPEGREKIVDYRAKWDEDSLEYQATTRTFAIPAEDAPLLQELGRIALQCWEGFDLAGYARVDFRVDHAGRPWVLEVNANPCISPDSGFVAASLRAGISYPDLIARILAGASGR